MLGGDDVIDYKYKDLFRDESIDKQFIINFKSYKKTKITNEELFSESISLDESLCSDEDLSFGACEASSIKFKVANIVESLEGLWFSVSVSPDGKAPMQIGRYRVFSDELTADKMWREVVAYDDMYIIREAPMLDWYNSVFKNKESVTLKEFRDSFFSYFYLLIGLEQEDTSLINDGMEVKQTIFSESGDALTGAQVISAICEANGCFGHIGRDGKFHYIHLDPILNKVLPSDDLYPSDDLFLDAPDSFLIEKENYLECNYEDYITETISKLQIRTEEGDIGCIVGTGDDAYVIQDNFLLYGKGHEELSVIANKILNKVGGIYYRPFDCRCVGNPCLEVGDPVCINAEYNQINSYVLKRTLSGIQAMKDDISATGNKINTEKLNSTNQEILKLKGKTNVLTRTVDGLTSTVSNIEENVESKIEQRAGEILLTVSSSEKIWDELGKGITLYGYGVPSTYYEANEENLNKRYLDQETGFYYQCIHVSDPDHIEWAKWGELELITNKLSSKIEQTASGILMEVASSTKVWNDADYTISYRGYGPPNEILPASSELVGKTYLDETSGYFFICIPVQNGTETIYQWSGRAELNAIADTVGSAFNITDSKISSKVSKGGVSSEISQEAGKVSIKSNRLEIESDDLTLIDGKAKFGGDVSAKTFSIKDATGEEDYMKFSLERGFEYVGGGSYASNYDVHGLTCRQYSSGEQVYITTVKANEVSTPSLIVSGTKSRAADTENYDRRLLYCYEMPTPFFGDIGSGVLDENGECYVDIDPVFLETVHSGTGYQVFTQSYAPDPVYISKKEPDYFVVSGTPGIRFDWEVKAKQAGYEYERLDKIEPETEDEIDYVAEAIRYLNNFEKEMIQ